MRARLAADLWLAMGALVVGCGPPLVGTGPGLSSPQRDQLQRAMPRPPIEHAAVYLNATAETDLPVSLASFSTWFHERGLAGMHSFDSGTDRVARISRVEDLSGAWARVGDRRRIVYADETSAVQELVAVGPRLLQVQSWNLTNHAGRYLRYVVEQIAYWEVSGHVHVRWTCSFRPRPYPDNLLIASYVREDYTQHLHGALAALRARALHDLGAVPPH